MYPAAEGVAKRVQRVEALQIKITDNYGTAVKSAPGSKEYQQMAADLAEYKSEAPFEETADDNGNFQRKEIKARGKQLERYQTDLAALTLEQGDHQGMRESKIMSYEYEMQALIELLEKI